MVAFRLVRQTFSWALVGLLAWDFYAYGPQKSVAVNAGFTLASRVGEASKNIPGLVDAGIAEAKKLLESRDDIKTANLFPFLYQPLSAPARLDDDTVWAIQLASHRTKISTDYLIVTAYMEAHFDANARSSTSSAAGMYQFIDSTWLQLMAEHGHDYGWAGYADEIACTSSGHCRYKGRDGLTKVMDLRYDSMTATFLSAEFARSNKGDMERALGRKVEDAELYLAHFLGAPGAVTLIQAKEAGSSKTAAALFPGAADANRSLFYRSRRHALSCGEFYDAMQARWNKARREVAALIEQERKRAPAADTSTS